jgi:hypothetical protein
VTPDSATNRDLGMVRSAGWGDARPGLPPWANRMKPASCWTRQMSKSTPSADERRGTGVVSKMTSASRSARKQYTDVPRPFGRIRPDCAGPAASSPE